MPSLTVPAYAKLNLSLDVLERRPDGYHNLRMVMQSVTLADELTVTVSPGSGVTMRASLPYLPNDQRNLAAAAALRFLERSGKNCAVEIALRKSIPVCAGMGGGSSDAAATLRALNRLTDGRLSPRELAKIGESVGSDVPYCVLGGTALAEGRGEVLTPLPPLPPCTIVACKPPFPISTPALFGALSGKKLRRRPDTQGLLDALTNRDLTGTAQRLYNVFEDVLSPRQARTVAEVKGQLVAGGALGACMSGTGPTVFGLFDDPEAAEQTAEDLRKDFEDVFLTEPV